MTIVSKEVYYLLRWWDQHQSFQPTSPHHETKKNTLAESLWFHRASYIGAKSPHPFPTFFFHNAFTLWVAQVQKHQRSPVVLIPLTHGILDAVGLITALGVVSCALFFGKSSPFFNHAYFIYSQASF